MPGKRKAAYYSRLLKLLFMEWNRVYKKGGNDHEMTDGYELNRIRDRILHAMQEIEAALPEEEYPEDYYAPVPELMSLDYMADPEGIRQDAEALYGRICRCSQWRWLLEQEDGTPENAAPGSDFYRVKGLVEKLEMAIAEDDLLTMRQFDDPDGLVIMLLNCHSQTAYLQGRRKKEKAAGKRNGWTQLSIEDWIT